MKKNRFLTVLAIASLLTGMLVSQAFAAKKLKVGFVCVSPAVEAGFSYSHNVARQELEKKFDLETVLVESVQEGPDAERVFLNMARKGFDLILGTSYGYMDSMLKVAKQFPDIKFEHCSGFKLAPNMGNYFGRIYQARYLTGIVAGMMTKSNKIGYVAAYPIPEVVRGIDAFALGVKSVNPEAKVHVVWTKTWYDPPLEKDAAKSLLDMGADIITQHQDSPGAQEAAQEAGVYCIGYHSDMAKLAPKSHLTAAIWNWTPLYEKFIAEVQNGTWKSESLWPGMEMGVVQLAPFAPMVPQDVQDKVNAAADELKKGHDTIFEGPIKDQSGAVKVKAGEKLDDKTLLGLGWFVDNVVGTTE